MRKFTKLLAIVMIACLLCGVIAVTVGAADTAAESFLNISNADKGITTQKYQDFEGVEITNTGTPSDPTYDIAVMNGTDRIITGYQGSAYGNIWQEVTPSSGVGVDGKYLKLTSTTTASTSKKRCLILDTTNFNVTMTGTKVTAGQTFQDDGPAGTLRMMTVDFDICATDYVFELTKTGETTKTKFFVSEIKEDAAGRYIVLDEEVVGSTAIEGETGKYRYPVTDTTNYTLSYGTATIENYFHYFDTSYTYKSAIAATSGIPNGMKISKNTSDNKWYISYEDGGTAVALAEKAGVWNHITVLYYSLENQESKDSDAKVTLYASYFLNGTYLGSSNKTFGTANLYLSPTNVRLEFAANVLATYDPSMGIDNVAVTAYTITENENTALATNDGTLYGFCKSGDCEKTTPTKPLNELTDVVYNKDTYLSPNELHSISVNDGAPVRYATQAKLLEALKAEGGTTSIKVKTTQDLLDYAIDDTIVDALENPTTVFTVEAPKFTLHEDFSGLYSAVEDENNPGSWTISKAEYYFYVQFCDAEGNPIEDVKIQALAANQLPADALRFPAEYMGIKKKDVDGVLKYCYYTWEYNGDNDPEGDRVPFEEAFTETDIEEWFVMYSDKEEPLMIYLKENIDENKMLITWYAPNGDVYDEKWLDKDTKITHPVYEDDIEKADKAYGFFEEGNNGWYDKYYTTWINKNGGDAPETATQNTEFVVDKTKFTPALAEKKDIKGIRYNLRLTGNSTLRVFAPFLFDENGNVVNKADDSIPDNIEYVGIFSAKNKDAQTSSNNTLVKNGDTYLQYGIGGALSANSYNKAVAYLGFKVTGSGSDVVVYYTVEVSYADYAEAVLAKVECGSEEAVLVLAGLQFIEYNANTLGRTPSDDHATKINEIKEAHANCPCSTQIEALKANAGQNPNNDVANLKAAGVDSVEFKFSINQPSMIFNVLSENVYRPNTNEGADKIYKIVVKYNGIVLDGTTVGEQVYESTFTPKQAVDEEGKPAVDEAGDPIYDDLYYIAPYTANKGGYNDFDVFYAASGDQSKVSFRIRDVAMCNAAADFTVELYNKDSDTPIAVGTYSISDYIDYQSKALADAKNNEDTDAEQVATKALNAATGLYVFAEACLDYKVITDAEKAAGKTPNPFL